MELYHGVRSPRLKRDWRFGLAVGTAVLLILLVTVPLFFSARLFYRHHGFVRDLSSALVHSQTLTAAYGEERWNVSAGSASRLFTLLVDAGAGRPKELEKFDKLSDLAERLDQIGQYEIAQEINDYIKDGQNTWTKKLNQNIQADIDIISERIEQEDKRLYVDDDTTFTNPKADLLDRLENIKNV